MTCEISDACAMIFRTFHTYSGDYIFVCYSVGLLLKILIMQLTSEQARPRRGFFHLKFCVLKMIVRYREIKRKK